MANYSVFAFLLALIGCISAQDCAWNRDVDFPSFPPLLIDTVSWVSLKAVLEGGNPIVRQAEGASIVIACSGNSIVTLGVEVAEGVCTAGSILIGSQSYTVRDLDCAADIKDASLDNQGPCGNNGIGTINYLGFNVGTYPFYPVVKTCFEATNEITLYSQNIIYGKSVTASEGNPSKPSFRGDTNLYSLDPNNCYLTANQDAYATQVTGDPNLIDLNSNNYFSRGHLAPNADFLLDMEADASYYYINAMPQWQLYNAGNWVYLENGCRDLAVAHQVDLQITTGPMDKLIFTDVDGVSQEAFICDSQSQHVIPVPLSIWKVVYDPVLDQGVAVITSNVPNQVVAPTPVCPTIDCMTITWLAAQSSFSPTNFAKGYTYCCTVQDLHAANPNSPDLPTAGLLIN